MDPSSNKIKIPYSELHFDATASRGPGGQNVNRTNSAVILKWWPLMSSVLTADEKIRITKVLAPKLTTDGCLVIRSDEYRDQPRNREECIRRLMLAIEKALEQQRPRRPTRPTKSSIRSRLDSKKKHGDIKRGRSQKYRS